MNLEQSLQEHEEHVDALIKSAKRYVSALSAWKKACRTGHLANRQKAAAQAEELAPALPGPTAETAASWTFDLRGRGLDCGHHMAEEAPDDVASELIGFLA